MTTKTGKFWTQLGLFQVAFGIAVFFGTRHYYLNTATRSGAAVVDFRESFPAPLGSVSAADFAVLGRLTPTELITDDPNEIARHADSFFANKDYAKAAELYQRLLEFDPKNPDTINNFGITLHYLGRSDEALDRLIAGVAENPTHQRAWLTLGFVSTQVGNIEQARHALTNAAQLGSDEDIRQSAQAMLNALP